MLAGSLAGADRPFLQKLYAAGIRGSYDGLAIHPYGEARAGTRWIHAAQVAAGDRTPLWITEFGWTDLPGV